MNTDDDFILLTHSQAEPGDRPVRLPRGRWDDVRALASYEGGGLRDGDLRLSAADARAFSQALYRGLYGRGERPVGRELRGDAQQVMRLCSDGRGLVVEVRRPVRGGATATNH